MDEVRRGNLVPGGQLPVVKAFAPSDGIESVARTDCVAANLFSPLAPPLAGRSELTAPPYQESHTEDNDAVAETSTH